MPAAPVTATARRVLPARVLERPYGLLPTARWQARGLRTLEGGFAGERCFVIGNGPSLNDHDLSLLDGEYTFGVNSIFLKPDLTTTFYTVEDRHVVHDNVDAIRAYPAPIRFFPVNYRSLVGAPPNGSTDYYFLPDRSFYEPASPWFGTPRFSLDCARHVAYGQTVTYVNLQLAYYLGFHEVYLIGMDFSYSIPDTVVAEGAHSLLSTQDDDANHFDGAYFGRGKRWHDPQLDKVERSYRQARLSYELGGRRIANATVGGHLEVFDRVEYTDLFATAGR